MTDFRRLFAFVRPHLGTLAFSLVLLMFAGAFEVLTTSLAIPLFDDVLVAGAVGGRGLAGKFSFLQSLLSALPGNSTGQLAIALAALTFLKGSCLFYSNYGMSYVGHCVVTDLRNRLYSHVMSQSMGFFSLNSTGRLMSRMNSDVEQLQEAVSTTLAELFREMVLLFFLVCWVFYIDWRLASLALLIAPV